MNQAIDLYHLIWKCPHQPSRLKDPTLQRRLYKELHRLRKNGLIELHRLFHEQYHLDALVSVRTNNPEPLFERLQKCLTEASARLGGGAPLYFEANAPHAFDRFERARNIEFDEAVYDPIPSPIQVDIRPIGESRRFLIRNAGRLSWPIRRVFHLSYV